MTVYNLADYQESKKTTILPAVTTRNLNPTTHKPLSSSQNFDLPRSIGNLTRVPHGSSELSSLEDVSIVSQTNYRSNKSIMDSDTDDDHSVPAAMAMPTTPSKRAIRQQIQNSGLTPKKNMGQLNAYGIPLNNASNVNLKRSMLDISDRIRVCVRKRPLSKKEIRMGQTDVAPVTGRRTVNICETK